MSSTRTLVRGLVGAVAGAALAIPFAATPAQADPIINLDQQIDITTTVKKLNKTIKIPTGTLAAKLDLADGSINADMTLPTTTDKLSIGSLPLANVTIKMHQAAPTSGTFDFATAYLDATAHFKVQITAIKPVLTPFINLVSGSCTSKTAASAQLTGPLALGGVSEFDSTFTLPDFKDCGLLTTPVINLMMAGPGNTMHATIY